MPALAARRQASAGHARSSGSGEFRSASISKLRDTDPGVRGRGAIAEADASRGAPCASMMLRGLDSDPTTGGGGCYQNRSAELRLCLATLRFAASSCFIACSPGTPPATPWPQALPCSLAGCTLCACSAQVPHLHRSDKSLGPCTPLSTCSTFTWARLGLPHDHSPGRLPLQHTHCHWMTSLLVDIGPIQLIQSFMQAPVQPMHQAICLPFADQFNTTRPEWVPALAARRQASAGMPGVLGPVSFGALAS